MLNDVAMRCLSEAYLDLSSDCGFNVPNTFHELFPNNLGFKCSHFITYSKALIP